MTRAERWISIALATLTFFVGVSAFFGGVSMISQPSGTLFRLPSSLLARTPLETFMLLGGLLLCVGVLSWMATWALLRQRPGAWLVSALAGTAVVVIVAVQLGMIGYIGFPQPLFALVGVAIFGLAVALAVVERSLSRGGGAPASAAA